MLMLGIQYYVKHKPVGEIGRKHQVLMECNAQVASRPAVQRKVRVRTLPEVTELIIGEVHILTQAGLTSRRLLSTTGMWALDGTIFR